MKGLRRALSPMAAVLVTVLVAGSLVLIGSGEAQACTAVYRFYDTVGGSHFYTASVAEKEAVEARWPGVYTLEGTAYLVNEATNLDPVHRFYNMRNGSHFYTASAAEKAAVESTWSDVYKYEGVGFNVSISAVPGSSTVYRFYNTRNGSHFYTASEAEKDRVLATWPGVYTFEGAAFWIAP